MSRASKSASVRSRLTHPAEDAPRDAIVIHLGPGPKLEPERVTARGEELTFFLDATEISDGSAHNFKIGPELPPATALAESDFIERGESAVFKVDGLQPRTYRLWCSVDEHYALGMTGTLVVKS